MRNKKSGFWNFILSWIPGCSEMYMGFMKMGLSLMLAFWGIIVASILLNMGPLIFGAMIAWFYSFFHARNLYHTDEQIFMTMEDDYLFHFDSLNAEKDQFTGKYRKVIAGILIVFGIVLVFRGLYSAVEFMLPDFIKYIYREFAYDLPQVVVGIGIIAIGKIMLDGKKKELFEDRELEDKGADDDGRTGK